MYLDENRVPPSRENNENNTRLIWLKWKKKSYSKIPDTPLQKVVVKNEERQKKVFQIAGN